MTDLVPMTPLGAAAPLSETYGTITIAEVTDRSFASVSARLTRRKHLARGAKALLGAALPGPGRSAGSGALSALWIGPDQWLFTASADEHDKLDLTLKEEFGDAASVTLQTDGWACFSMDGDDLGECLLRLVQPDLHDVSAGDTIRTAIDHVSCILVCDKPGRAVRILCPRSLATHLHHGLTTAALSVSDPS